MGSEIFSYFTILFIIFYFYHYWLYGVFTLKLWYKYDNYSTAGNIVQQYVKNYFLDVIVNV